MARLVDGGVASGQADWLVAQGRCVVGQVPFCASDLGPAISRNLRRGARLLYGALVLATGLAVLSASPWAAEPAANSSGKQMDRVTNSPDPVLRAAPLERQRITPDPTPGLRVPSVPGRQAVVLRDYAGAGGPQEARPVVLHIPVEFFARTSAGPDEVWGINLHVQYPAMRPFPRENACAGHCDGRMLLGMQNSSGSQVAFRLATLREDVARQAASADPSVVYTRREPPAGYTEAYDKAMVKWQPPGRYFQLYARTDEAGVPAEFVQCYPTAPSPGCEFLVALDGLPQVKLQYTISMEFWDRRDEVRAAVQRLVRSFLPP